MYDADPDVQRAALRVVAAALGDVRARKEPRPGANRLIRHASAAAEGAVSELRDGEVPAERHSRQSGIACATFGSQPILFLAGFSTSQLCLITILFLTSLKLC